MAGRSDLVEAFHMQSRACGKLGSPFMQRLLSEAANEIERTGSVGGLLDSWPSDPVADAVPLRLAAALHALVLSDADPRLATFYPGHECAGDAGALWPTALAAVGTHRPVVEKFLGSPPQTNEVGRAAVLLGGFLEIARATGGMPMRLLEIGASAGLNLLWDRYRYELDGGRWGDPDSSVTVTGKWRGPLPPLDARIAVADRAASDADPVDPEDDEARLRLRAYVWADQPDRLRLLDAAVALVRRERVRVERGEAAAWVTERLRHPAEGCATVLYHSIAWEYFPEETQRRIWAALLEAGQRATAAAPLGWLRLEPPPGSGPGGGQPELGLTLWPGGDNRLLARAHTHGPPVEWLAGGPADG